MGVFHLIDQNTNIIISGGGTGGHLFPALALGSEIEKINSKINVHYVGSVHGIEHLHFQVKSKKKLL